MLKKQSLSILLVFFILLLQIPVFADSTPSLNDLLNVEGGNLEFETGGLYPFSVVLDPQDSTNYVAASSNQQQSYSLSYLKVKVTGPKALSFRYKVSSEYDYDVFSVWLDVDADNFDFQMRLTNSLDFSDSLFYISGNKPWKNLTLAIPEGEHEVFFIYSKDTSIDSYYDTFYLDSVWVSELTKVNVTVNSSNSELGLVETEFGSNSGEFDFGSIVTLKAIPNENSEFLYWKDSSGNILSYDKEFHYHISSMDDVYIEAYFLEVPDFDILWYTETDADGSENNPYIIKDAGDLAGLSALTNWFIPEIDRPLNFEGKYIKLGNDIDLSGYFLPPISYFGISSPEFMFGGTFDGDNHTIYGHSVLKYSGYPLGLFGTVNGNIKNLTLYTNGYNTHLLGGICGIANNATISDCNVYLNVQADECLGVGGIVLQQIDSTIKNCYSEVNVDIGTVQVVGGITGAIMAGNIENCKSKLNIPNIELCAAAGGICGTAQANSVDDEKINVIDCESEVYIENNTFGAMFGGIFGYAEKCNIYNCKSDFNLINYAGSNVAGICGQFSGGNIEGCYANVDIKDFDANSTIGSIVGYINDYKGDFVIDNCVSAGVIDAPYAFVGGIVGQTANTNGNKMIISNSSSYCDIIGYEVGGICGYSEHTLYDNTLFNGRIRALYKGGGIVQVSFYDIIKNSICASNIILSDFTIGGGIAESLECSIIANSYFSGKFVYDDAESVVIGGLAATVYDYDYSKIASSYYLQDDDVNKDIPFIVDGIDYVELIDCGTFTMDELACGKIAYQLNKAFLVKDFEVIPQDDLLDTWTQGENHPVFASGNPIRKLTVVEGGNQIERYEKAGENVALPEGFIFESDDVEIVNNSFTMPKNDVTVYVTGKYYTISIGNTGNETIEVDAVDIYPDIEGIQVVENTKIKIKAIAGNGYKFVSWWDGVKDAEREITVTGDIEIWAIFEEIPVYTIAVTQTEGGIVSVEAEDIDSTVDGIQVYEGTKVKIKADAQEGYTFTSWWDNDTSFEREITINGDLELSAQFTKVDSGDTLTFTVDSDLGISKVIVASYKDKKLVNILILDLDLKAGVENKIDISKFSKDIDTIKVFIWEDLKNAIPKHRPFEFSFLK